MCPSTGPAASDLGMRRGAQMLTNDTSPTALATAAPTTVLRSDGGVCVEGGKCGRGGKWVEGTGFGMAP